MRIKQSENKVLWYLIDKDEKIISVEWTKAKAIQALRELNWKESKIHKDAK